MVNILTFEDAIEKSSQLGFDNNLLLGNGFSIEYNKDIFAYSSLFENSNMSENVKAVFKEFNTVDFEAIINKFVISSRLMSKYSPEHEITPLLKKEADEIKKQLVDAISQKHPNAQNEIGENRLFSTFLFLSNFKNIFTLNYDLLLYWTLMNKFEFIAKHPEVNKQALFDINDGFHGRAFLSWGYESEKQNVFYLHGALHLFDNATCVNKMKNNEWDNLISIIQENLEHNKYPLIVAEGLSKEKLIKIKHNEYLNFCLNKLLEIEGNLFIHGHSLAENDMHIFQMINKNTNIKSIYISIHKPEENFEEVSNKALDIFRRRLVNSTINITFYDAATANIWSATQI